VLGICVSINISYTFTIVAVLITFFIHYIAKGPFNTLIRRYLNNFTTSSLRNKISSSFNMLENIFRSLICFLASFLLRFTTTANVFIILGCFFTIAIILMLDNMRTRVGLRPDEYSNKDINILDLK